MTMVNASPMALLLCIFGWSFWAYNFRLAWSLASDGQVLQGNIEPFSKSRLLLMFFSKEKLFCTYYFITLCFV
jgi:palmitoyltransferase